MSCYFCDSSFHLSNSCDIYDSIESRKEFVHSKNHCTECLAPLNSEHSKCRTRCFICFSEEHHTVFCSERESFFIPKIDQILVSRFFQVLSLGEQFAMANSYPSAMKLKILKPFVVLNHSQKLVKKYYKHNIIANGIIKICYTHDNPILNLRKRKSVIIKARRISFFGKRIVCVESLFNILTPFTNILALKHIYVDSDITFSDILQRIPNIEILVLRCTNIKVDYSWPQDLLKYANGNKFQSLRMTPNSLYFDVAAFALFMKKRTCTVSLLCPGHITTRNRREFEERISKYFIAQESSSARECAKLNISFGNKKKPVTYVCKENI